MLVLPQLIRLPHSFVSFLIFSKSNPNLGDVSKNSLTRKKNYLKLIENFSKVKLIVFFSTFQVITVPQIISLSQRWMEQPGAKAEVYLESLGDVGQLCQDHLRIMLQYGDTALTLLLPIKVMNRLSLNDCKCVAFLFYYHC